MSQQRPTVSVIIPCYNSEATIGRAVRSVLAQTMSVEAIVVDDGSSDQTVSIVKAIAADHENVRVVVQSRNGGPAAARNRGIGLAQAPWFTPLDADDVMAPDRLERLMAYAVPGNVDIIGDDLIFVTLDEAGPQVRRLWSDINFGTRELGVADFVEGNISARVGIRRELGFLKPILRTDFFKHQQLAYRESLRTSEDYIFYTDALMAGANFLLVDPCGYFAISRADSLSHQQRSADLKRIIDIDTEYLSRNDISPRSREAFKDHRRIFRRTYVWLRLIEATRARDLRSFISTWFISFDVSAVLLRRCIRHALGLEVVPLESAAPLQPLALLEGMPAETTGPQPTI